MSDLREEEIEKEIALLNADPDVQLARAEQRAKYRRRQYLYTLRYLKHRGQELRQREIRAEDFQIIEEETKKCEETNR